MTWAQILGIALGIALLTIIILAVTGDDDRRVGISRDTMSQVNVPPPALGNQSPSQIIGTDLAGTNLTAKQCRVTCAGKCGGPNPLIPITKSQKTRNQCHDNCRATICQGISAELYNQNN